MKEMNKSLYNMIHKNNNIGVLYRSISKPIIVHSIFFIFIFVLSACNIDNSNQSVSISKEKILLNGKPYFIKGICYHPVPVGSNDRSFGSLTQDIELMIEAGINTIRLYKPIDDLNVLDQIHRAGIKVIVGFGYNQNGFYDILTGSFID